MAQWKDGALRPLCVFDNKQLQQTEKIADGMSWSEIPTCKSQGIDVEYLMLRGVFTTPGAAPDQVAYYIDVLKKVRETPEWKALMNEGAFNQTFMTGADFAKWLSGEESRHRQLMQEAASSPVTDGAVERGTICQWGCTDVPRGTPATKLVTAHASPRCGKSGNPLLFQQCRCCSAAARNYCPHSVIPYNKIVVNLTRSTLMPIASADRAV